MQSEPFFRRDADCFVPTTACRGPWNPKSLHGRVVIGLLAAEIERRHGGADLVPARLTVDMYRLPDFSPAEVTTRLVRDGRRIKVVDAEFMSGGVSQGRATCQLLLRTGAPDGTIWRPPDWNVPRPEDIAPPQDRGMALGGMWETRPISGRMGSLGERRIWMREVRELIEGAPLTPFVRAALAGDFASPFANAGDKGLFYINSDVTLYLHRMARGEWLGLDVVNHQASEGVAIGACTLYDVDGAIGTSSVAALVQKR
jgi:hypothetical protein